jgi:carbonic anhydrase
MIVVFILANLILTILASGGSSDWGYDGKYGPSNWPGQCSDGQSQSPIDISSEKSSKVEMEPFVFRGYKDTAKRANLANNGHTVAMSLELHKSQPAPTIYGGGLPGKYTFAQFHFHWGSNDTKGSEHTIDTNAYPLELHFVHFKEAYGSELGKAVAGGRGANDTLAVLGVLFKIQENDNLDLNAILEAMNGAEAKGDNSEMTPFPLVDVLPRNTDGFYRYSGSLTTPGCNEVVIWSVFKSQVPISGRQMLRFRKLLKGEEESAIRLVDNFRPVQPLNGRLVRDVETSQKIFGSSATSILPMTILTMICLILPRF